MGEVPRKHRKIFREFRRTISHGKRKKKAAQTSSGLSIWFLQPKVAGNDSQLPTERPLGTLNLNMLITTLSVLLNYSFCPSILVATAIAPSLTKWLNLAVNLHSHIPRCWKEAIIVPVPKKQGASSLNDFRPISLYLLLSKVLERDIYSLISEHICNHSPLSNFLFKFQYGKSTVSTLLSVTHDWLMYLEKRQEVGVVFLITKRHLIVFHISL